MKSINVTNSTSTSPLNPQELQVLRAQYEKEGEMVGIQTKFNYAWVCFPMRSAQIFIY